MIAATLAARLNTLSPNVYIGHAPLDYLTPAVVYNHVATRPIDDLDGTADAAFLTVQVDVYDPIYLDAEALANEIRDDLKAWAEDDVAVTWSDYFSDTDTTTDRTLFRVVMRFSVFARI